VTFAAAQQYLLGLINETASRSMPNRLDRMIAFLHELGDPQLQYATVHVAGTSGKGSTATMIAAALQAGGARTGLHAKPHLASVTERARVDGVAIPDEAFGELLSELSDAGERIRGDFGRPTYYEQLLALAYVWFARNAVSIAVIEAGIGGMLDGTNLMQPAVSVITNVALDHQDVLGDTVEEIARDKAGIAKPGVPLLTDARDPGALAEIVKACAAAGAPLHILSDEVTIENRGGERYGQTFGVTTPDAGYDVALPLLGAFQQRNAAVAIRALELLPPALRPSRGAIENGLANVQIPGRMEFFPSHPAVVFDIAHNPDKAANLAAALLETFPGRRFSFVVAVGDTKDAAEVVRPLIELPGTFTFTSFSANGRTSMRPQRLASIAESQGAWGRAITDPVDAFTVARRNADADTVIVVTGSTFVVAELRAWWMTNVAAHA